MSAFAHLKIIKQVVIRKHHLASKVGLIEEAAVVY